MRYAFLLLLFATSSFAQQSTLHGTVAVFNSQFETGTRQFVANAQVEENYGKSQATTTAADGSFGLPLVGIKDKEKVFYSVKKPGFEVINTDALQAVAGQTDPKHVFMAPEGKIAENKIRYYQINREAAEKVLTEKLLRLEKEIAAAQSEPALLSQLQEEYGRLQVQFKEIEDRARELAERYAKTNLDDMSNDYQRAFRCFQRGQLDSALLVFTEINLGVNVGYIISEQIRNEDLGSEYEQRNSEKIKRKQETNDALIFKAHLHYMRFEYDQAEVAFQYLMRLDSLNSDNLMVYGFFLMGAHQLSKAQNVLNKAFILKPSRIDQANIFEAIGVSYVATMNSKTEETLLAGLELCELLLKEGIKEANPKIANINKMLGVFYNNTHRYKEAETCYLNALNIYTKLSENNQEEYEPLMASIKRSLGVIHGNYGQLLTSKKFYLEALEIYQRYAKMDSTKYEPQLAGCFDDLGVFFAKTRDFEKAKFYTLKALDIEKKYMRTDPYAFNNELGRLLNNLGRQCYDSGDYQGAFQAYGEALEIYKEIAKASPGEGESNLADTYNKLGNTCLRTLNYQQAEQYYLYALSLSQSLNSARKEELMGMTCYNLGLVYNNMRRFEDSEKMLIKALEIREKLYAEMPESFEQYYMSTYSLLLITYNYWRDSFVTEQKYILQEKLHAIYSKAPKEFMYSGHYTKDYAKICGDLAWYYLLAQRYSAASSAARQGLELAPKQEWIKTKLAHALLFEGNYAEAEKIYNLLKDRPYKDGKTFRQLFLEELDILEKAGINCAEISNVRQILNQ